jgi:lipoate-protein ligase A
MVDNPMMRIQRWSGSARELHARQIPDPLNAAVAWVLAVDQPSLVLGSGQPETVADSEAAGAAGVEVVRRNSGGGAVLLRPGRCLWIDVLIPRDDARWVDDVGTSTHWLGDVWASTLGQGTDAAVHRGTLQKTAWGRLVCFGAVGPGEVTVQGRKVVGISQRRTRVGARLQCLVLDRWDPAEVLDLLSLEPEVRTRACDELASVAAGPTMPLDALEAAVIARLRE